MWPKLLPDTEIFLDKKIEFCYLPLKSWTSLGSMGKKWCSIDLITNCMFADWVKETKNEKKKSGKISLFRYFQANCFLEGHSIRMHCKSSIPDFFISQNTSIIIPIVFFIACSFCDQKIFSCIVLVAIHETNVLYLWNNTINRFKWSPIS